MIPVHGPNQMGFTPGSFRTIGHLGHLFHIAVCEPEMGTLVLEQSDGNPEVKP